MFSSPRSKLTLIHTPHFVDHCFSACFDVLRTDWRVILCDDDCDDDVVCIILCLCLSSTHAHLQPEGEDELKKMQLMELAIINGTFRTNEQVQAAQLAMAQKLQAVRKCLSLKPAAAVPHLPRYSPSLVRRSHSSVRNLTSWWNRGRWCNKLVFSILMYNMCIAISWHQKCCVIVSDDDPDTMVISQLLS